MIDALWPLFTLRLRTPGVELRLPPLDDLAALAEVAAAGIHDPAHQPFLVPWTDAMPEMRARSTVQFHWRCWGEWQPAAWRLGLVAVVDGAVVGMQEVWGDMFAVRREVQTGSWLGLPHQGRGIGTHMRAAVLHLAFAGLGAESAVSTARLDNLRSMGVSRTLGYVPDGIERRVIRDEAVTVQRLRLDRASWEAARSVDVEMSGLEPCLPLFGVQG